MTLFDQEENQFDPNKDYLAELTGPGGKFDKAKFNGSEIEAYKAMARGKAEADRMIEHKNKEFDELREDYLKAQANATAQAKFEDLLTRMENKNSNTDSTITPVVNVEQPTLDPLKLEQSIEEVYSKIEQRKIEKANLDKVDTKLKERFGDNAQSILKDKMKDLGITNEDLKILAKRSPEAALNALGLNNQQESYQAPPRGSLRTDPFSPKNDTVRDLFYYEKMRREEPKKYFSPDISVQRLKDMDSPLFLKKYNEQRST